MCDAFKKDVRGWIDTELCEFLLTKDIKVSVPVDGSESSTVAFAYATEGILLMDKTAFAEVVHVYSPEKTYLPPQCRAEAVKSMCEARLMSTVSSRRYGLKWLRKDATRSTSEQLCAAVRELQADFVCMGYSGLKGKKQKVTLAGAKLSSNVWEMLNNGTNCSLICLKDDDEGELPLKQRKGVWVVSVGLNKASTKAFLDALRLSKPDDEIHVVYVKSWMENEDSDYTQEVREKFEGFFKTFGDDAQKVFSRYQDRSTRFEIISKDRRETIPQAVVRYADTVEADFVVVGANAANRVARGKVPVGSVSLQICLLWERNFVVATWIDAAAH